MAAMLRFMVASLSMNQRLLHSGTSLLHCSRFLSDILSVTAAITVFKLIFMCTLHRLLSVLYLCRMIPYRDRRSAVLFITEKARVHRCPRGLLCMKTGRNPKGFLPAYAYCMACDQSRILTTLPEPTVLPPSRIAKRRPCSQAIGWISSTVISTLSPGMHISVPSGSWQTPVTSVVLK